MRIDEIYNMDCFDGMKEIEDKTIDMILCDLPYGKTRNKWDIQLDLKKLWEEYKRIIKENGVIALTASQPYTSILVMSNVEMFRHEWIWLKNRGSNFGNVKREPMKEHEEILIFSRGKWTYNAQMQERTGGGASRVKYAYKGITTTENYGKFGEKREFQQKLRVPSSWQKFNTEVGTHHTQKPTELFEYLIKTYTNEGELILDNCIGSGTTAIAAIRTGRHFIGFEKEKKYFDIAETRIEQESEDKGK